MGNYSRRSDLSQALKGMTITIAYVNNAPPQSYTYNTDGVPSGGFLYDIFNQSAKIGGFNIKWVLTPQQGAASDDIYLANITSQYDAVAKASFDTIARRLKGVSFTPPLVDASLTLIINSQINHKPYVIKLSFLDPFGYDLWGGIVAAIAFHALMQYFLNRTKLAEDQNKLKNDAEFIEKMKIAESRLKQIQQKKKQKEVANFQKPDNEREGRAKSKEKVKALKKLDAEERKKRNPVKEGKGEDNRNLTLPRLPKVPHLPQVDSHSLHIFDSKNDQSEEAVKRRKEKEARIESKKQIEYLVRQKLMEEKTDKKGFWDMFYFSYIQFSTIDDLEVDARTEKWMKLLFSFFLLIIVSTYTANLATYLISANSQKQLPISNIAQANAKRARICFRKGAAAIALTTAQYKGVKVVSSTTTSNIEVLQMLQRGECDAAILAHNDWQIAIETAASYQGWAGAPCNLQSVDIFRTMYVSLPFQVAHNPPYCTSFFGDVLSSAISQMQQPPSFLVDAYWSNALAYLKQNNCQDEIPVAATSEKLTIQSMAGLFIWYLFTSGVIGIITIIFNWLDIDMEQHEKDLKLWILSWCMPKDAKPPPVKIVETDRAPLLEGETLVHPPHTIEVSNLESHDQRDNQVNDEVIYQVPLTVVDGTAGNVDVDEHDDDDDDDDEDAGAVAGADVGIDGGSDVNVKQHTDDAPQQP